MPNPERHITPANADAVEPATDPGPGPAHAETAAPRHLQPTLPSSPITVSDAARPARGQRVALGRGQSLGRYVVLEKLGAGGMGVVYRAFDPDLDRSVALKLVAVDHGADDEERARLLREAQAMARLSHPNVIPVFDVGVASQSVFVAMEFIDGPSLSSWLQDEERAAQAVLDVFIPAGRGLAAAHRAGLVHRDFKPDNVMVGIDGRVRVLDFGLARAAGPTQPESRDEATEEIRHSTRGRGRLSQSLDESMTAAGTVMGTPAYMSPEQHLGESTGPASDQFSFCVALWEALYGRRPFGGDNYGAISYAVTHGEIEEPQDAAGVPSHVDLALRRGLSTQPTGRYPDMDALLVALTADPSARRRRIAGLSLGAAGILVVGGAIGGALAGVGDPRSADAAAGESLCTGSEARLGSVWSQARRDAVAAAFERTEAGFAKETWAKVGPAVDGYAQAWVTARTESCRAARITGEQSVARMDLQMQCLDRRLAALDAQLDAFARADAKAIERALDAVGRLPSTADCEDATAERFAPPPDPLTAEVVAIAEPVLLQVRADLAIGRYDAARGSLGALLVTADASGHPPLAADAWALMGEVETGSGNRERAGRAYDRAWIAAMRGDDEARALSLATDLAHHLGYAEADLAAGRRWLGTARALGERQGITARARAELDSTEGAMLVAAGRFREGLGPHRRAEAFWRLDNAEGPQLARVLDDIGGALVNLGEIDEAVKLHQRALEIRERFYGPTHPFVATTARQLGNALSHEGRFEEALPPLRRALAVHRAARGEVNSSVAIVLDDLGRIQRRLGDNEAALARHREALAIWEQVLPDPHPDLAVSILNVGYTLVAMERGEEAVQVQQRALRTVQRSVGDEHPFAIYAANALGHAHVTAGSPHEAVAPLRHALTLTHLEVVPTLFADTHFLLARALWPEPSTRAESVDHARTAIEIYATKRERWAGEIDKVEQWLAERGLEPGPGPAATAVTAVTAVTPGG